MSSGRPGHVGVQLRKFWASVDFGQASGSDRLDADRASAARYFLCCEREPAQPPLTLFKAMLIAVWHDSSDMRLAEALGDRASFRRFCSFSTHAPTPRRTEAARVGGVTVQIVRDRVARFMPRVRLG
ncbi:transposase [Belnapia moabensis]|uniref:transposase n=1 Tax=Belnapia moabensis TaxID=365533 RepID=UPI0038CD19F4